MRPCLATLFGFVLIQLSSGKLYGDMKEVFTQLYCSVLHWYLGLVDNVIRNTKIALLARPAKLSISMGGKVVNSTSQ